MGMSAGGSGSGSGSSLSEINVTPLVDVMLVLLIIFMVTTPMIQKTDDEKRQVEMDLPVTRDNDNRVVPQDTNKMILEIDRELKVFVGKELVVDCSDKREGTSKSRFESCFDLIEQKLGQNQKLKDDGQLFLLADTEIPYGFVVGTMARVRKAGISKLGMVTNPEYIEDAPPKETPPERKRRKN